MFQSYGNRDLEFVEGNLFFPGFIVVIRNLSDQDLFNQQLSLSLSRLNKSSKEKKCESNLSESRIWQISPGDGIILFFFHAPHLIAHLGETRGEGRRRINFPPGRRRNRWWY